MPRPVHEATLRHLDKELMGGGYEAFLDSEEDVDLTYRAAAELIGAGPTEVGIVDSATTAWDRIIYSLPHRDGDRLLTTTSEYGSNWAAYLHLKQRFGVDIVVVPDTEDGDIDVDSLASLIDTRTTLITLNHVPTNGSVVNPAAAVGRVARDAGVPFLLDACQSVGQLPIDVEQIGCDFLTTTSRKFIRGPRGIGLVYVRAASLDKLDPVVVDNHSTFVTDTTITLRDDARRFETWEKSWANVLGFGAACRYALDTGVDAIWERIRHLGDLVRTGLVEIPGVTSFDRGAIKSGMATFAVDGRGAIEVFELLSENSINVSYSTINSAPYDMRMRGIEALVRASVHAYNTEEEIDEFLSAMDVIAT